MPKIDVATTPVSQGSTYPKPFDAACLGRHTLRLGLAGKLTQFGVNLLTLSPGSWASQRHWHTKEDEFAYVLSGEVVLVEDSGETVLKIGDSAAWPAGVRDGHHLQNRSQEPAVLLIVGSRDNEDSGEYSDIDMRFLPGRYSGKGGYSRKDGTPY